MQISPSIQAVIQQKLSRHFSSVHAINFNPVGGGSINDAYRISLGREMVFCKVNSASKFPHLFQKEKAGLELIAKQAVIKTPAVIECFENEGKQFLLLEWIEAGERTEKFWKAFGQQLAVLHRATNKFFGLNDDNYMGSVVQQNQQHESWPGFFAAQRLRPMIKRCADRELLDKKHLAQLESLEKKLPDIFNEEKPSLVHGDLWSGNFMCNAFADPLLLDPAVYYGHRSVDLAMTTLFGGFRQPFYEAYHYHFPLPLNYKEQWEICNLYPLLIHLYLFGPGYLPQIQRTLNAFA
jgi:protein-ribulosamine 3-kinase